MAFAWKASGLTYVVAVLQPSYNPLTWHSGGHWRGAWGRLLLTCFLDYSYNKYLSVAARTVRRSLKDDKRLAAERRGQMELRFAKWTNGKQGDTKNVVDAIAASNAEAASSS
ncbi:hypothetical protein DSL72_005692 [Monilinia vaccinii-corymbosi]|uniref:Mitochondrial ATP synthase epsilon chain domain-containing protein n=1 Tax=Monilinia vaccinii-corymbosi TaxID=61207 RepID=A0A8A3PGE0_9HELO|nr:hypothetical protein DSL72_005692 [Monilinia vaccinii-corymbosi]